MSCAGHILCIGSLAVYIFVVNKWQRYGLGRLSWFALYSTVAYAGYVFTVEDADGYLVFLGCV
jgi:hypothetical protein